MTSNIPFRPIHNNFNKRFKCARCIVMSSYFAALALLLKAELSIPYLQIVRARYVPFPSLMLGTSS